MSDDEIIDNWDVIEKFRNEKKTYYSAYLNWRLGTLINHLRALRHSPHWLVTINGHRTGVRRYFGYNQVTIE